MTDEPQIVKAALLDENGVFLRIDSIPIDQLTPRHLPQITECDLPPGKARWNSETLTFEFILNKEPEIYSPNMERAIALGLISLFSRKAPHPETLEWLKEYANSFDMKGFS